MSEQYKILIADDEVLWVNLLGEVLKGNGYQIHVTTNAYEVEKIAISKNIDLILLDVNFPDANGLTICSDLKANPSTEDIAVVMLTAQSDPTNLKKGFEAGADDYLEKQASSLELIERMKVLLKAKSKNRSLFLYKNLFESSPYAMMVIEGELIASINLKFSNVLKYDKPEEIINSTLNSLIHEDELDSFRGQLNKVKHKKHDNHPFPYKFRRKDNTYIDLVVHMIRVNNSNDIALYCNTFS
jgi:PAS domain S-box-containing protein